MADEKEEGFKPDVPTGTNIVMSTPEQKKAYLAKLAGESPSNECHFYCQNCGQDKTLQFEADEMKMLAAMSKLPREYDGPCWNCGTMCLMPYDSIESGAMKSVHEMASQNRKKEYGEAADVFIEKVQGRIGDMFGGGGPVPGSTLDEPTASGQKSTRDNLPDADDVDISGLKPRQG